MTEPTYIATASKGDVVFVSLPGDTGPEDVEKVREELQPYLSKRGIGLIIVGNGALAEVGRNGNAPSM